MKYTIYIILILLILSWFIPIIPTIKTTVVYCIKAPCPAMKTPVFKTLKEIINYY